MPADSSEPAPSCLGLRTLLYIRCLTLGAAEWLYSGSMSASHTSGAWEAYACSRHWAEHARLTGYLQSGPSRTVEATWASVPMKTIRGAGARAAFETNVPERSKEEEFKEFTLDLMAPEKSIGSNHWAPGHPCSVMSNKINGLQPTCTATNTTSIPSHLCPNQGDRLVLAANPEGQQSATEI